MMDESKIEKIRKADSKPSIYEEIKKYVLSNLLSVVWSMSLLGGGFIFWIYFFQIQYFPDLNLQEAVLSLAATALLGLIYVCVFAFILLSPIILDCMFAWASEAPDEKMSNQKNNSEVEDNQNILRFGGILLLGMGVFYYQAGQLPVLGIVLAIVVVIVIVSILVPFLLKKIEWKPFKKHGTMVGAFLPILLLEYFFTARTSASLDNQIAFLVFVLIVNFYAFFLRDHPEKSKVYWVYLFVLLGVGTPIIFPIPKIAMGQLGYGGFDVQRFLVNEMGYKIFKKNGLVSESEDCKKPASSKNIDNCLYKNITILSRLGSEYRLEKVINGEAINFNISKDHVLSWSTIKSEKKNHSAKNPKQVSK